MLQSPIRSNRLKFVIFAFVLLLNAVLGSKFACEHSFRSQYSLFMVTSRELAYNTVPLTISFNGVQRQGTLFFNMCEDIQLTNVCGSSPVIGKFIFVDKISRVGRSKCLIFKTVDLWGWNYSADSRGEHGRDARGGILLENKEMTLEASEVLSRDTLQQLDLASITTSQMDPDSETENLNISDDKLQIFKQALDQKISNLNRQSTKVNLEESRSQQTRSLNLDNPLDLNLKGSGSFKNYRILTKSLVIKPTPSKMSLDSLSKSSKQKRKAHRKNYTNVSLTSKVSAQLRFKCQREGDPEISATFSESESTLEVSVSSVDGCVIELSLLQLMSILPVLTALLFAVFGFAFLYLGFLGKVYCRVVFIIFSEVFLFFSLYFLFAESLDTSTKKLICSVFLLLLVVTLCVLSFFFNLAFYLSLAFLGAIHMGMICKLSLQEYSEFFFNPHSEWWLIMLFLIALVFFYLLSSELFVIMCTAVIGTTMALISLKYFHLTDYDFLFNTQIEKFVRLNEFDPENGKFAGIFFVSVTIGIIVQYIVYRKYKNNEDEIDILNQAGKKVEVNIDNI